jgi:hypothetical protein
MFRIYKPIDPKITQKLLEHSAQNKSQTSLVIDNQTYTYDRMNFQLHTENGDISIYFRTNDKVIRISNHWSKSANSGYQYNRGKIRGKRVSFSCMVEKTEEINYTFRDYPITVLGGLMEKEIPHNNKLTYSELINREVKGF